MRGLICAAFLASWANVALAQPSSARLTFEVASVKPEIRPGPGRMDVTPRRSGDLVMMHNTQPSMIILYAYHLDSGYQMEGYSFLPEGWNWYDIDARAPAGATDDQVRVMFQSLLADRFKLKVHREKKAIPEFEIVPDKGKTRLQASRERAMDVTIEGKTYTQPPGTCGISLWLEGSHLVCHAATIDKITSAIGGQLHSPVVDRTGLSGTYDLHIRFLPDDRKLDATVDPAPSFEQALQDDLGLKLQKGTGLVDVLVIDHMEKPDQN